jgi:CelD/BcsL family acetyltransferase involved in cellulose biosynthesis
LQEETGARANQSSKLVELDQQELQCSGGRRRREKKKTERCREAGGCSFVAVVVEAMAL